jgi:hypothetical protein
MAFVTVDNPSGILHHGAHMGWCAISDTRLAIATVTTDLKVLVQEINFAGGNANLGLATFVAAIPGTPTNKTIFRPKVYSIGTDAIMVMVPTAFATVSVRCALGNSRIVPNQTGLGPMPSFYSVFIMTRNADGTYTSKSTASLDFTSTSGGPNSYHQSYPGTAFELVSATPTQLVLMRPMQLVNISNEGNTFPYVQEYTITLANNVIQSAVKAERGGATALASRNTTPYDIRYKKLPDKSKVLVVSGGQVYSGPMADSPAVYRRISYDLLGAFPTISISAQYPNAILYISPNAFLPIDAVSKHFIIGGNVNGANTAINTTSQQSTNSIFYNPLDTAWITPTTLCVAGCPAGQGITDTVLQQTGPFFDHDMSASVNQSNNLGPWPLFLSMREIGAAGQYVGVFDPIQTPYYYNPGMMCDNVIHRIDDTHFAMIGVFKADINAAPKIGVITVNV